MKLNMYMTCLINDFGFSEAFLAYSKCVSSVAQTTVFALRAVD